VQHAMHLYSEFYAFERRRSGLDSVCVGGSVDG
jgi:hypothetical protein